MDVHEEFNRKKKYLKPKYVMYVLLILFAGVLMLNATYTIEEQEQVVLTTLGRPRAVAEPGLHFKVPFIQKIQKVDTTINAFSVGYVENTNETINDEAIMITSDFNFVNVDFFVEYRISDPVKAVYASKDPFLILQNIAQSSIRSVISSYDVDSVLTTGKNAIQSEIREIIIERLDNYDIGVQLINVTIQDSEPPTLEVMEAFKAVETAKQKKETAINNANKYRNEKLPDSQAQIDKILKNAQAYKEERISEAKGQVARFNSLYEEYAKFPLVTKERMFYETMEDLLPSLEVIIDGSDGVQKLLPLNPMISNDSVSTGNISTDTNTDSTQNNEATSERED
jgi:modulator of FtsH protease HflK